MKASDQCVTVIEISVNTSRKHRAQLSTKKLPEKVLIHTIKDYFLELQLYGGKMWGSNDKPNLTFLHNYLSIDL